jgi:hypothetical protein
VSAPTVPTDHDEYEALAVAWVISALEPAEQTIFEAHWAGCGRCARTVAGALEIAAELAYGVPDVVPPPRLRERVLAAAAPQVLTIERGLADDDAISADAAPDSRAAGRPADDDVSADAIEESRAASTPGDGDGVSADAAPDSRAAARMADGDVSADGVEESRAAGTPAGDEAVSADRVGARAAGRLVGGTRRPKGTGPGRARVGERGRRRLRWAYALAAAVLVAGSAVTTWEVTRAPAATDRVAVLSAGSGTIATVVVHRNGADVVTDTLPANTGRGTAYYVWGVPATDGGTPQVVGTFEVTAGGLHSYPLRVTRPAPTCVHGPGSTPTAPSRVLGKGALGG